MSKENTCPVCKEEFPSSLELSKHTHEQEDCFHYEVEDGHCVDCGEDMSGFEGMARYDSWKNSRYDD